MHTLNFSASNDKISLCSTGTNFADELLKSGLIVLEEGKKIYLMKKLTSEIFLTHICLAQLVEHESIDQKAWVQTPLGAIFDEIYFVLCNFRSVRKTNTHLDKTMNILRLFVIASTIFDCIVTPGVKSLLCNISLN